MARIDKYEPYSGGFRAALAADFSTVADFEKPIGVSLNTSGLVVVGAVGNTGILPGILVLTKLTRAGTIVDVMTDGELAEFDRTGQSGSTAFASTAGTNYWLNATTGAVETSAPAAGTNKPFLGWTVEAKRLIVRAAIRQG